MNEGSEAVVLDLGGCLLASYPGSWWAESLGTRLDAYLYVWMQTKMVLHDRHFATKVKWGISE